MNVAHFHVSCPNEPFVWDDSSKTLDISKNLADPSDCIAKAVTQQPKAKPSFTYDGTNILSKNGYGTLKMKPATGSSC